MCCLYFIALQCIVLHFIIVSYVQLPDNQVSRTIMILQMSSTSDKNAAKAQSDSSHKLTFFSDFLSSLLCLLSIVFIRSRQALPGSSTVLSSERKARLKTCEIVSQSAGDLALWLAGDYGMQMATQTEPQLSNQEHYTLN